MLANPIRWSRTLGNETYVIALNPSGNKVSAPLHLSGAVPVLTAGKARVGKNRLSLNAFTAIILKINNK